MNCKSSLSVDLGICFVSQLISNLLHILLPQCEGWKKLGGVDRAAVRKESLSFLLVDLVDFIQSESVFNDKLFPSPSKFNACILNLRISHSEKLNVLFLLFFALELKVL